MSTVLQVAGMCAITAGALMLLSIPAGLVVGGVFLVVIGLRVRELICGSKSVI
jgi:hypothetical protein